MWHDSRNIDMHNNLPIIDKFWEFIWIQDSMIVGGWKQYNKSEFWSSEQLECLQNYQGELTSERKQSISSWN